MFLKSRQNRLYATSMKRLCIAKGNEACTDSNSKNVKQHISWYMYFYHVLIHVTIKTYCTNVFTTYVIADKNSSSVCLWLRCCRRSRLIFFFHLPVLALFGGVRLPFCAAAADTSIFDCSSFIFLMNIQSEGFLLSTDEFHFWWNPTITYKYNLTWLTSMK